MSTWVMEWTIDDIWLKFFREEYSFSYFYFPILFQSFNNFDLQHTFLLYWMNYSRKMENTAYCSVEINLKGQEIENIKFP